jgi:hypothetical protein
MAVNVDPSGSPGGALDRATFSPRPAARFRSMCKPMSGRRRTNSARPRRPQDGHLDTRQRRGRRQARGPGQRGDLAQAFSRIDDCDRDEAIRAGDPDLSPRQPEDLAAVGPPPLARGSEWFGRTG